MTKTKDVHCATFFAKESKRNVMQLNYAKTACLNIHFHMKVKSQNGPPN